MSETNRSFHIYIIVAVLIFTTGIVLSTYKVADSIVEVKGNNVITVTGSAKKQLKSDLIVWTGSFNAQSDNLKEAYTELTQSHEKVRDYLKKQGISDSQMVFSSIMTATIYEMLPNGTYGTKIVGYRLDQNVEISSRDVDRIADISRKSTEIINEGVQFQSNPPQYYYTKIADMKVNMLAEATKDAKNRADQIAKSSGASAAKLTSAKMGVFQITPLYSTEVSDSGIFDTYSLDKEITAVVTCNFEVK